VIIGRPCPYAWSDEDPALAGALQAAKGAPGASEQHQIIIQFSDYQKPMLQESMGPLSGVRKGRPSQVKCPGSA
jgi:hypothetical protein